MATKAQKAEQAEAIQTLREWLKPGMTIYCSLKHVSRSGMQREIGLHYIENGELRWLSGMVCRATGWRRGKRDGIIADGCGMDMGFHLVSTLSRILYPDGFGCIGKGCPSNDHSNGDRDFALHGRTLTTKCPTDGEHFDNGQTTCPTHVVETRPVLVAEHWHREGDYALRHRWI